MMTNYIVLIFAAIATLVIAKFLAWPLKKIIKLGINIILGAILIYLINVFGAAIGISITFNIITALIVGIFGLPGAILLIILSFIM